MKKWTREAVRIVAALAGLSIWSVVAQAQMQGTVPRECPGTAARVYVTASGVVTLNGNPVAPTELAAEIKRLPPTINEICYSRENGRGAPHPSARMAFPAVMDSGLKVTLYSDGTFRNAVVMKAK